MKTAAVALSCLLALPALGAAQETNAFRVLATSRTSTMQKEMKEAGEAGYRFAAVMGGETAVGGKEVVVVMQRPGRETTRYDYRLLATTRTSTMQKELQEASDGGFQYVGQTVFDSAFGGKEVVCILEHDPAQDPSLRYEYRLFATTKTSTMEKELREAGDHGYEVLGMTVGRTAIGGSEIVAIARRLVVTSRK